MKENAFAPSQEGDNPGLRLPAVKENGTNL